MAAISLDDFGEVLLVDFEFNEVAGEVPMPVCLTAREYRGGTQLRLERKELHGRKPFFSAEALCVFYDAPAALGCHLALGWPLPVRVLDVHAEFRCLIAGLEIPDGDDLPCALAHFGLKGQGLEGLTTLVPRMLTHISLGHALLRGRYAAAVARMEAVGIPIDVENLVRLRKGWWTIQDALIERVDQNYGVFDARKFNPRRWATWLNRNRIRWPRLSPTRLDLSRVTFRDMAKAFPEVRPMKELLASLSLLRLFRLAVGADGRNRVSLRPFASKTGRNQPSTSKFIFGPATWLRGLIRPTEGMAVANVDYAQQEFGIAAALSKDPAMMEAYRSGDSYLAFAKQIGAVPADATKESHRDIRDRFKQCALGVQYGMGAKSLGIKLGLSSSQAQDLLRMHRRAYSTYWRWSNEVEKRAFAEGRLESAFGWRLNVNKGDNPRSLRNFPLQANAAEMLRLACCFLTEAGVRVCAPIHDAILVEALVEEIEAVVVSCAEAMQRASEAVLPGFALRTDAKIVRFPDRYEDPRGKVMWDIVFELLDRGILNHVHENSVASIQRCNI